MSAVYVPVLLQIPYEPRKEVTDHYVTMPGFLSDVFHVLRSTGVLNSYVQMRGQEEGEEVIRKLEEIARQKLKISHDVDICEVAVERRIKYFAMMGRKQ